MKKSDLKSKIKEEIIDILEAVTQDDVNTQQDYNAELEKTAKLSKDAGLTESLNPEVSKKVDQFIKAMAKRYDYEEKEKFKDRLRELNKIKKELESLLESKR